VSLRVRAVCVPGYRQGVYVRQRVRAVCVLLWRMRRVGRCLAASWEFPGAPNPAGHVRGCCVYSSLPGGRLTLPGVLCVPC